MIRSLGRWFSNWRNGATVVAFLLVVLVAFTVIDSSAIAHESLSTARASNLNAIQQRKTATRRIDRLTRQIIGLQDQAESNGEQIGVLIAEVTALQAQVRDLGGEPVVVYSPAPASSTTTTQPMTTTTTAKPHGKPSATTTSQPCRLNALGVCVGKP